MLNVWFVGKMVDIMLFVGVMSLFFFGKIVIFFLSVLDVNILFFIFVSGIIFFFNGLLIFLWWIEGVEDFVLMFVCFVGFLNLMMYVKMIDRIKDIEIFKIKLVKFCL